MTVTCVVIIHVGDLLYTGCLSDFKDLQVRMAEFKHGEWESLTTTSAITYFGIVISMTTDR